MNSEPIRIAVAGLGTVGAGVIKILQESEDALTTRAGLPVQVAAVSARSRDKDRGVDLSSYKWVDDPLDLLQEDNVDVVLELMGGSEGPAYDLVSKAVAQGKSVVTANKALMAHHGFDLAEKAQETGAKIMYEAAVAGGIPIIKLMREGFSANEARGVYGILNGTCNYILTVMRETGRSFEDVLSEAQERGYAEADPAFDIEGTDAAHKLALLAALAYGVKPDLDALSTTGITKVTAHDIAYVDELGYRIKLLGIVRRMNGSILQVVEPCLVPSQSQIALVEGVFNAVFFEGNFVDKTVSIGHGAGAGPTASSVVADIVDLARGSNVPVFGAGLNHIKDAQWASPADLESRFYIRLLVLDKPGVLADISGIMRDHDISMEVVLQRGQNPENPVDLVIKSHQVSRAAIDRAAGVLKEHDAVVEEPVIFRIEDI